MIKMMTLVTMWRWWWLCRPLALLSRAFANKRKFVFKHFLFIPLITSTLSIATTTVFYVIMGWHFHLYNWNLYDSCFVNWQLVQFLKPQLFALLDLSCQGNPCLAFVLVGPRAMNRAFWFPQFTSIGNLWSCLTIDNYVKDLHGGST